MRSAPALDHVTITTDDFARSAAFYDAALGALGMTRLRELVDEEEDHPEVEAAAWGAADVDRHDSEVRACIWLVSGDTPTTGLHLQLRVESTVEVETFYQQAIEHGAASHLAPRRWTPYRRGEFQAIVRDPAGNLLEACSAE